MVHNTTKLEKENPIEKKENKNTQKVTKINKKEK